MELRFQRIEHDSELGRWRYVAARAVGPLAESVELFWSLESVAAYQQERILPRSTTEVMFNLGSDEHRLIDADGPGRDRVYATSWVAGLQQRPLSVESPSSTRIAGIRLRSGGPCLTSVCRRQS
jgi:hypothetical protein